MLLSRQHSVFTSPAFLLVGLTSLSLSLLACSSENADTSDELNRDDQLSQGGAAGQNNNPGSGASSAGDPDGGDGDGNGDGDGDSTDVCSSFETLFTKQLFDAWYPNPNPAYTHQGVLDAVSGAGDLIGFPDFASSDDCEANKRELAAFFANVSRETGQLRYIEQINKSFEYCDDSQDYACPAGADQYFGRGPIQLSWNYNYKAASQALFGDDRLLNNPDLVAEHSDIAWATALWFWMTSGYRRTCHSALHDGEGFGQSIRIINGNEECDGGFQSYAIEAVSQRVCYFEKYTSSLSIDVGPGDLNCGTTLDREQFCDGI